MKFAIFQGPFEVIELHAGNEVETRLQELLDEAGMYATAVRIDPDHNGEVFGFTLYRPVISNASAQESITR